MKSAGTLTVLVTLLTATVLTIGPVPSRAENQASDFPREQGSETRGAALCSLEQQTASAGCATPGRDRSAGADIVMRATEGDYRADEASGALLEDLVKNDQGEPQSRL